LASVQFVGDLATDAVAAAGGRHAVAEGAALNVVLVPDVSAHDEQGDAGHDAAQEEVEAPALAHPLGILVRLAREAKPSAAQMSAVSLGAAAEGVVPLVSGSFSVATSAFTLSFSPAFTFAHFVDAICDLRL